MEVPGEGGGCCSIKSNEDTAADVGAPYLAATHKLGHPVYKDHWLLAQARGPGIGMTPVTLIQIRTESQPEVRGRLPGVDGTCQACKPERETRSLTSRDWRQLPHMVYTKRH